MRCQAHIVGVQRTVRADLQACDPAEPGVQHAPLIVRRPELAEVARAARGEQLESEQAVGVDDVGDVQPAVDARVGERARVDGVIGAGAAVELVAPDAAAARVQVDVGRPVDRASPEEQLVAARAVTPSRCCSRGAVAIDAEGVVDRGSSSWFAPICDLAEELAVGASHWENRTSRLSVVVYGSHRKNSSST